METFQKDTHFAVPEVHSVNTDWFYWITSPDTVYPMHCHTYYEIHILLNGKVSFVVDDRIIDVQPGNVLVTRPYQYHHAICDTVHENICVCIDTTDSAILSLLNSLSEDSLSVYPASVAEQIKTLCIRVTQTDNNESFWAKCQNVLINYF